MPFAAGPILAPQHAIMNLVATLKIDDIQHNDAKYNYVKPLC